MTLMQGNNMDEAVHGFEACIVNTSTQMDNNIWKLNPHKAKLITFSSKQSVKKNGKFRLKRWHSYTGDARLVKNLGIIVGYTLETEKKVNGIYKLCYYQNLLHTLYVKDLGQKHRPVKLLPTESDYLLNIMIHIRVSFITILKICLLKSVYS